MNPITKNDVVILENEYHELNNQLTRQKEEYNDMDQWEYTSSQLNIAQDNIDSLSNRLVKAKILFLLAEQHYNMYKGT